MTRRSGSPDDQCQRHLTVTGSRSCNAGSVPGDQTGHVGRHPRLRVRKWFATTEAEVAGIGGLAEPARPARARAAPVRDPRQADPRPSPRPGRRLLHPDPKTGEQPYFEACARRWAGVDFDALELPDGVDPVDLDAVAAIAVARLAEPLRRASCRAH